MEKQVAVIVGVGAVAAALVGGLGWKTLKGRTGGDKLTAEQMEERKAILRARLQTVTTQEVEVVVMETEAPEPVPTVDKVIHDILHAEVPAAVHDVIEGAHGGKVLSISRPRAVTTPVQPDQTPMFWSSFESNLRRPEVVEMSSKDFETRNGDLARGYHKCRVDGVDGILHVTKSNVSAVLHMGGDEFTGISTSRSRFNGKGLVNLSHEQAKNFLTGR